MQSAGTITGQSSVERARLALAAMFLVNGFLFGSWAPQIPLLLPRHQITETTLGLLIFMLGVGAVGAMMLSGRLIALYGSRRVLRGFALSAGFALVAVVFAPNLWWLTPAMVVMGALFGTMDVAMNANAVEVERRLGRAVMSALHGMWSLGGFIGGFLGGMVMARFGSETHALLAAGTALLVAIAASRFLLTEPVAPRVRGVAVRTPWPRSPAVYVLGVLTLFSMIPEGAVLDWAALYMSTELGADVATSGFAYGFFAASMALMRFAGDRVRNRFGAVTTLRVSAVIGGAGLIGAAVAPTEWAAIVSFAVAGLGIANMIPVMFSAAGNLSGVSAGSAISTVTMIGYSGILIAPSAIGFVAEHVGYRVTYAALALLLAVVAGMAARTAIADRTVPA